MVTHTPTKPAKENPTAMRNEFISAEEAEW